jgi:hypothetical protein
MSESMQEHGSRVYCDRMIFGGITATASRGRYCIQSQHRVTCETLLAALIFSTTSSTRKFAVKNRLPRGLGSSSLSKGRGSRNNSQLVHRKAALSSCRKLISGLLNMVVPIIDECREILGYTIPPQMPTQC